MLLRRLLRGTNWALLTAALLVPAAHAADTGGLSPQEVVSRFVAAINARDPAAQKCELLTPGLRDLFVVPRYAELDERLPESYGEENRLRACDAFVGYYNGYVDDGGIPVWQRTEPGPPTTVEQTDTLAHLRVPLRYVFDDEGRPLTRDETADVFLRLERGGWKLVWPSLLWTFELDELGTPPATSADLPALLAAIERGAGEMRAREERLVGDYLRTRVPVQAQPLPWAGHGSFARDRLRDVRSDRDEELVADQRLAPNDVRAAALRSDGRTLTFELRFRERVPDALYLSFGLQQRGPLPRGQRFWSTLGAGWQASLTGGWVSAWTGGVDEPEPLQDTRASVDGRVLRIAFPAATVRDEVRLARLFRWSVSARVAAPPSAAPVREFADEIPSQPAVRRKGGIAHPQGAREPMPACTAVQALLRNRVPEVVGAGERFQVRIDNLEYRSKIRDATISTPGAHRRVVVGDAAARTFHVRAPDRPGRFRVAITWRQVDEDRRLPPVPECRGRDVFVVTATRPASG